MEHLSEQGIELYVLRGSGAGPARRQVEAHLKVCAGCRDLVDQAASFYEELQSELKAHPVAEPAPPQSLARRPRGVPALFQSPFREAHLSPVPATGFLRRLIWNHPFAVGGGGLALAGGALLLVMNLTRPPVKDLNPVSFIENKYQSCLEVYNKSGEKLWTKPVPHLETYMSEEESDVTNSLAAADLDGDGMNEVITTLPVAAGDGIRGDMVHILKYDGTRIRDLKPGEALTCRNRLYPDEFHVDWFTVGDFSGTGKNEILLVANDLHSPAIVSRFDGSGKRLGTYRHFGQLRLMPPSPKDDGRNQLVLFGWSDREEGKTTAILFSLDPAKIVGDGESSCSGGFGLPPSPAEEYYVQILQTEVAKAYDIPAILRAAKPVLLDRDEPGFRILSTGTRDSNGIYFEYIFRTNFTIVEVKSENQTKVSFDRMSGRTQRSGDFFDGYLKDVAREIRYWDGRAWLSSPVPVRR